MSIQMERIEAALANYDVTLSSAEKAVIEQSRSVSWEEFLRHSEQSNLSMVYGKLGELIDAFAHSQAVRAKLIDARWHVVDQLEELAD
jgi:hypothetical protein